MAARYGAAHTSSRYEATAGGEGVALLSDSDAMERPNQALHPSAGAIADGHGWTPALATLRILEERKRDSLLRAPALLVLVASEMARRTTMSRLHFI